MGRLFGTDGVRGVAGKELTPELAFKIGSAGACVLANTDGHTPKILVGKDTRISGDMLEAALTAGLLSAGADVISAGVIPTPAIAYLVRRLGFDAGVMISASHNPYEHNGIKFFSGNGYKLSDQTEEKIEEAVLGEREVFAKSHEKIGRAKSDGTLVDKYIEFAVGTTDVRFDGLKIAIDCANGAASVTAKAAFEALGATVFVSCDAPNGVNINKGCGSTHLDALRKFVKETGADAGLAFDGDADRVLAVDEKGNEVDGDQIMTICALDMKKRGCLKDNTIVATVMSNLGLFKMAEDKGLKVKRTKVGDRYVLEEMVRCGHKIGGEQSGHVILLDNNTTGDGLVTGIALLSAAVREGKSLSALGQIMKKYPQVLVNAKVKNENKREDIYLQVPKVADMIKALNLDFAGDGRVLIRPSGTEALVRVMIEGNDPIYIKKRAEELAAILEECLN